MKKVIITSILVAIATLWSATVNAQSVTFMTSKANKAEGISYTIRAVNPNLKDSAKVMVEFSVVSNFSTKWFLKEYVFTDSIKIITDSLDGYTYGLPTPPATIYIRATEKPDTSKWAPVYSGIQTLVLIVKARKPKMNVVVKPVSTMNGPVTTLSVNSNVPWKLLKYFHFKDSTKTFSSGSIQEVSFNPMNGTIRDTIKNVTQNGFVGYKIVNEAGDTQTVIMRVSQFVINAKPWSKISLTNWDGTKWVVSVDVVGNNLVTTISVLYLEPGSSTWKGGGSGYVLGYGVEPFNSNIASTLQGTWSFKSVTVNSIGSDTSETITNTNKAAPVAFSISNGKAAYIGPGIVKFAGTVSLSAGNKAYLTALVSEDSTFAVSQASPEVVISASGDIEITFYNILSKGNLFFTWRGYDKNNVWIDRVRPYSTTFVKHSADVKPVTIKEVVKIFPNPTTASEGFTVNCANNKPETLTMFDATGKKVYEAIVSNNDLVKPNLPAGLYNYKLGNTTGRVLFH